MSEAAALADTFVFRLMFRLYWLPVHESRSRAARDCGANTADTFFERKRLLNAFAARKYPLKLRRDGKAVAYTKYLVISALALDTIGGACSALLDNKCGVHDRRPLSCRSVPFHYSRTEASGAADLTAFVATKGYECDTSDAAPIVWDSGRVIDADIAAARSQALAVAQQDRRWSDAIVRRMNAKSSASSSLPSVDEVEANARLGAMTTSMQVAWRIAADAGLIAPGECDRLVAAQLDAIGGELARPGCSQEARRTLGDMQAEYRQHLSGGQAIAMSA